MEKLESEWVTSPHPCPLCDKVREANEYCIQVFTVDNGMFCVTQKNHNATIVYKDPNIEPQWGTLENLGFVKSVAKKLTDDWTL